MIKKYKLDMSPNEARQHFITKHALAPGEHINPAILDSWIRSLAKRVNPHMPALPERLPRCKIIELINQQIAYDKSDCLQWLQVGYDHLCAMKSVLFLATHKEKVLLAKGGCRALLDELKTKNIGIGAVFSPEAVGTTAIALAAYNDDIKKSWVIGAQHWIDALTGYVTACTPIVTETGKSYLMLVCRLSDFTSIHQTFFNFYMDMYAQHVKSQRQNIFYLNNLINLSLGQDKKPTIFFDEEGTIFYMNNRMSILLDVPPEQAIGMQFYTFIPGGKELFQNNKRAIAMHEVMLDIKGEKQKIYINLAPIFKENEKIGYMISAIQHSQFEKQIISSTTQANYTFDDLIGVSTAFIKVKSMAMRAAMSSSTVLITGSSGTGKELFAQSIHNKSSRKNKPFVPINCAALPKELINSELFGYSGGAFTGAKKEGSIGKFEMADGGTLFLDEIAEMPLDMQTVLLRAIEERSFYKVGSTKLISVDVRIIAATNKNLAQLVACGKFRSDLYYRLNVIHLELAPLSQRREDIPFFLYHYLHYFNIILQRHITGISDRAMELLMAYNWPGNVRELRNVVESAINMTDAQILTENDLSPNILTHTEIPVQSSKTENLANSCALQEHQQISTLMTKHNGNKARVAKELGIARSTLYRKLNYAKADSADSV